jgi:hypothetical protein
MAARKGKKGPEAKPQARKPNPVAKKPAKAATAPKRAAAARPANDDAGEEE